jgi:pyridoxal phosphate enzyme (YggS family)
MSQDSLRENLFRVQERIAVAAHRAGRRPEEITLVGVSKMHPAEAIHEAYKAGLRHFGENRVQEWEGKRGPLGDVAATWHLIGHLQSNKAARAAKLFHSVDSVDDYTLAQRLDRSRGELGEKEKLRVLIEVRIAPEETKSGVDIADLPALAENVAALLRLELAGLMCIPPFLEDAEQVRPFFRHLQSLRDDLAKRLGLVLPVLSMGMSHDFEIAIEEGATEVRVGTALFGTRAVK